jgi:hypothetical protein
MPSIRKSFVAPFGLDKRPSLRTLMMNSDSDSDSDSAFDCEFEPLADPDVGPSDRATTTRREFDGAREAALRHHFVDLRAAEPDSCKDFLDIQQAHGRHFVRLQHSRNPAREIVKFASSCRHCLPLPLLSLEVAVSAAGPRVGEIRLNAMD